VRLQAERVIGGDGEGFDRRALKIGNSDTMAPVYTPFERGIVCLSQARRDRMVLMIDVDKETIQKTTAKAETRKYKSAPCQTMLPACHQPSAPSKGRRSCSPLTPALLLLCSALSSLSSIPITFPSHHCQPTPQGLPRGDRPFRFFLGISARNA
jgi:hypothetical protein